MHQVKMRLLFGALLALPIALNAIDATAQAYPSKPVRVIVPFPAGGVVDILTRAVTDRIAANWGTPVIVEPRPGAGASLGADAVATSAPDGHTYLVATITGAVGPLLNPQFKHDLRRDFAAVGMFATAPNVFVVPANSPVSNLEGFVTLARKSPGKLNYAHAGAGSTSHLPIEFLKATRRIFVVPIPYRGQPQAIKDVIAGDIHLFSGAPALLVSHVKAGKLKAIAVTSARRLDDLPHAPTLAESGYGDVVGGSGWFGIVAPVGTPAAAVRRFNEELNAAVKAPEVVDRLRRAYAFPASGSPEEFAKFLGEERARWSKLIKESNLKAD